MAIRKCKVPIWLLLYFHQRSKHSLHTKSKQISGFPNPNDTILTVRAEVGLFPGPILPAYVHPQALAVTELGGLGCLDECPHLCGVRGGVEMGRDLGHWACSPQAAITRIPRGLRTLNLNLCLQVIKKVYLSR